MGKNKVNQMEPKMPTSVLTSSVLTLPIILNIFALHVSRSVMNMYLRVKPQNKSDMVLVLWLKVYLKNSLTGLPKILTMRCPQKCHVLSSLVVLILLVSKFLVSILSNNCALTSPTKNFNNSSTTLCSFSNKKNTRKKVSNGPLSTLVWISRLVLNLSKNHSVSFPFLKKNVCFQKLLMQPTEKSFTEPIWVKLHHLANNLLNLKVNAMLILSFIIMLVPLDTTSATGSKRTRIQSITLLSNFTKNLLKWLCKL